MAIKNGYTVENKRTNIPNVEASMDNKAVLKRFSNMLHNVSDMITKQGPIYSTWIKFQMGINKPIVFDTSSRNKYENLIASLTMTKNMSGVANSFQIVVRYDPFNFGQDTQNSTLELLDEYIAEAMSHDWDDDSSKLQGKIQYGYNYTENNSLISPCYQFILTEANCDVDFDSGMTTYTFGGTSVLATDCDFETPFPAVKDVSLLQLVIDTLYKYYGNPNKKPSLVSKDVEIDEAAKDFCYDIDISNDLFKDSPKIEENATSDMSPWKYCQWLLENNPLTKSEEDSGDYDDLSSVDYAKRPRYSMWLSDTSNGKTIHITHGTPEGSKQNLTVDFDFTWTRQNRNLVLKWSPQVKLMYYLIQRSNNLRTAAKLQRAQLLEVIKEESKGNDPSSSAEKPKTNPTQPSYRPTGTPSLSLSVPITGIVTNVNTTPINPNNRANALTQGALTSILGFNKTEGNVLSSAIKATVEKTTASIAQATYDKTVQVDEEIPEMYDAEMTTIGIPADVPALGEIRVKPIILETVSRTAGVYAIKGATDTINNQGLYTTTFQLFRYRGLNSK